MTKVYCARWVLPISSAAIEAGALAVEGQQIAAVGTRAALITQFPEATICDLGESAIIPGLVNAHSHLELTAMRGFLEREEHDFFAWLKKLTLARLERMTADDLNVSAAWGACEAARAGVSSVADASDSALQSMNALREVGLRGIVFQESFGPDPRLAGENFQKLRDKIAVLREHETHLVKCGVSPHSPYTVSATQLEMIAGLALDRQLPLMMHAAETKMEVSFLREGTGPFAEGLRSRGIEWRPPGVSPIQYLNDRGVLKTSPLLAHCIHIDEAELETLKKTGTRVAHCPKSNAKLGHGVAPLAKMMEKGIAVGLGSDSVASNNTCDLLEEARFAMLLARSVPRDTHESRGITCDDVLRVATSEAARSLGLRDQVGELKQGLQADFAAVSLEGAHQIPSYGVADTLIFASSGHDVHLTVVAGREVYRDGRVTTVDEDRLRARMKEIATKLPLENQESSRG
ncbi:MAG TPA: amidohydrolase family protein [Pyrinomonadaceae bacterium]|nr:amidohydrolase family protein [Pyrinomonadaceae bacterium]